MVPCLESHWVSSTLADSALLHVAPAQHLHGSASPSPVSQTIEVVLDSQTPGHTAQVESRQPILRLSPQSPGWVITGRLSCRHWKKGPEAFSQLLDTGMRVLWALHCGEKIFLQLWLRVLSA